MVVPRLGADGSFDLPLLFDEEGALLKDGHLQGSSAQAGHRPALSPLTPQNLRGIITLKI
jgi:hypothetical protein